MAGCVNAVTAVERVDAATNHWRESWLVVVSPTKPTPSLWKRVLWKRVSSVHCEGGCCPSHQLTTAGGAALSDHLYPASQDRMPPAASPCRAVKCTTALSVGSLRHDLSRDAR